MHRFRRAAGLAGAAFVVSAPVAAAAGAAGTRHRPQRRPPGRGRPHRPERHQPRLARGRRAREAVLGDRRHAHLGKLKQILHGSSASVGSDGVVTVSVDRKDPVFIDGIHVAPDANIETVVSFEPLNASGSDTAVMPDFDMTAPEVDPVVSLMRSKGWDIGCLYNQETAEHPQLYFSHEFRHGDPYALAAEVRQALDRMNVE